MYMKLEIERETERKEKWKKEEKKEKKEFFNLKFQKKQMHPD